MCNKYIFCVFNNRLILLVISFSLVIFGFLINTASAHQLKIFWTPEKIETSAFQGGTRIISLSFESSEDISNATAWIVPELKPFISIQPDNLTFIKAGEKVELLATIKIPKIQPLGAIEGTIHIRVGKKTIAKPLPMKINITSPEIVESKLEDFLIQQFGTTTPEIPEGQQFIAIEPPQEILDLVSANSNLAAVFRLSSVVFGYNLIPEPGLIEAGFNVAHLLGIEGVKTDELYNFLSSHVWHKDNPDNPLIPQSAYAATFLPGRLGLPSMTYHDGYLIIITDGKTHTILNAADTQTLSEKKYLDISGNLTEAASTAIHELLHVFHFRTECGGGSWVGSDNEEEYVALMETFIKHLFQNLASQYLTSEVNFIISNYPRSYNCLDRLYLTPPASSTLSYSDLTPTSAKISWTKNEDPDFQGYRV